MKKLTLILLILGFLVMPFLAHAQPQGDTPLSDPATTEESDPADTDTALPPTGFGLICPEDENTGRVELGACINRIYLFSLGFGSIVAVFMIVLAGYRYMTAQGNAQQVEGAKEAFAAAFIGLIIIFVAFILLNVINPDLTRFRDINENLRFPTIVNLSANPIQVASGGSTTLEWNAYNAVECVGDENFDTGGRTEGTTTVSGIERNTEFEITCTDPGGKEASSKVEVFIDGSSGSGITSQQDGSAEIAVDPDQISFGQTATLTWTSEETVGCTGSNFDTGGATSGNVTVGPFEPSGGEPEPFSIQYQVECATATGGTVTDQTTLNVQ